jgi:hypothetical protein
MRWLVAALAAVASLAIAAPAAQAAPPALGAVAATNILGVSALLKGTVDPEGASTSYYFEYGTAANFSGAAKTAVSPAGSGSDPHPARVAISGLMPDTAYHYRLVASNGSGTTTGTAASFSTTDGFGFLPATAGFAAGVFTSGSPSTLSSSHPNQLTLGIGFNLGGDFEGQPGIGFPDGDVRDLRIEMPPGLIVNPNALDECTANQFNTPRTSPFEASASGESCPDRSQVGTVEVGSSLGGGSPMRFGLFNLVPPDGVPAQLGFSPFGRPIIFNVELRPLADGSYALTLEIANTPQSLDISSLDISLWGTPWAASHNGERGNCLNEAEPGFPWCKSSVGEPSVHPPLAYLTLPSPCQSSLAFSLTATSWQQPGQASAAALNRDSGGQPVPLGSCATAPFAPTPEGFLSTRKASSSSGYVFRLHNENSTLTDPDLRSPSSTRKAVVQLPNGVTINPSVGAGLRDCSPTQYAAETPFNGQGNGCPNGAKIGEFIVRTPLFDGFFDGAVYLAQPDDPATGGPGAENPFDSLIAVYLVAKNDERGLMVKVAGKVVPDLGSGNPTAVFDNLPQLPYTDLEINFRPGQRSFLLSPATCGAANTQIEMTPWSTGLVASATVGSPIDSGINAGPCPSGTPPFQPAVVAGGVNSNVNSYTPFFIHLSRQDTEQEITSYSLVLPEGITGKLAGIPFCPDAAIEAARHRTGVAEELSPSCPVASEVGHVLTGYGVGNSLTYTNGRIYLAGPYNGQPLSLVVINPATVGPFDVGVVVIRSAFSVNERTAQLQIDRSASDRIPHILSGIPLHLRHIRIYMDRYQFTHNPSSCAPGKLVSKLTGAGTNFASEADDSTATATQHFQLLNCRTLGFQPKLGIRLKGPTRRGAYPSLRATFVARGQGDTNLKEIKVSLPRSQFLAQNHIKAICTKAQFASRNCPAASTYGSAVAHTPLFDEPLRGLVYLRSSANKLPDLVADLYSGAVRIVLEGRIGPTKQGGISAYFANLPDEPVDRFVMKLNGGRRGLLQNSANICANPPEATVQALGQTNLGARFTTVLRGQCKAANRGKRSREGR